MEPNKDIAAHMPVMGMAESKRKIEGHIMQGHAEGT